MLLRRSGKSSRSFCSIDYGFAFCTTGAVGLIKHWLAGGCAEPPREMTRLTYRMIHNMMTHGLARPVSED